MGALWGLPDFGARLPTTDFELYASYEPGPYLLWPTALEVGRGPGRPDLQLVLVRSAGAGKDYGVLDLGLERRQPTDAALALVRSVDPAATVAMVPFESGFIRLVAGPELIQVPPDLLQPSPLGWGGIDSTHWNLRLSPDSASILKAGLTNNLVLTARAEVEVRGVAPRLATTAVFDPAALLSPLVPPGAPSRQLPRAALDQYFLDAPANLPSLELQGEVAPADREAFALAMAGRVRMQFCRFVPSPAGEGPTYIELGQLPSGTFRWNLGEPFEILCPWVFTLDPFAAARELAKASGVDGIYREVTSEPLQFGFFDVDVQAFLPSVRLGLAELGAVIQVPAKPPFRPQADSHTVPFVAPADHSTVHLRLSPLEKLQYTYKTYAEVLENGAIRRLESAPAPETAAFVRFQPRDLPIDLPELSADPELLAVATLTGTLVYVAPGGAAVTTPFALNAAQRRVAPAVPRDAMSATLTVEAQPLAGGGAPLELGPIPAAAQHFTLGSFAEYGAHRVSIDCAFEPGAAGPFALDLLADGAAESTVSTVFLTRDTPAAQWSYVAASPFHAGYRWRAHPGGAWSPSLAPGAPLHVSAKGGPVAKPTVWELRGVHLYTVAGDPPGRVRYLPSDPTPQLDDQGRPTLLLLDTGKGAMLSVGARLELSTAQRADLEPDLLEKLSAVDRIDFQPAPFTVGTVTLSLADAAGAWQPLATTASMGAPPYNASFSVKLDADQRTRAIAALNGTARMLKVDYPMTLSPEAAATFDKPTTALTRTADLATWFPSGDGPAHIQKLGG